MTPPPAPPPTLAIIGGTSFIGSSLFASLEECGVTTPYGEAQVFRGSRFCYLQRHGKNANTPPHRINYHANLAAIRDMGITDIIAVNSTGSLDATIPPGTLLVPHDYFNLFHVPTFFDGQMKFTVPGLDSQLRAWIVATARKHDLELRDGGVYVQVQGPSLETPAEIAFIKQIGQVVGMTMAKEAILARELGLRYASICMVDNYANGIAATPLTLEEIDARRGDNLGRLERFLGIIIHEYLHSQRDA